MVRVLLLPCQSKNIPEPMEGSSTNNASAQSPGNHLAEQLFEKLLSGGLVTPYGKYVFIQQLALGELKESHWRNALNQALQPQSSSNEPDNL